MPSLSSVSCQVPPSLTFDQNHDAKKCRQPLNLTTSYQKPRVKLHLILNEYFPSKIRKKTQILPPTFLFNVVLMFLGNIICHEIKVILIRKKAVKLYLFGDYMNMYIRNLKEYTEICENEVTLATLFLYAINIKPE